MYHVACEVLPRATNPDHGQIDRAVAVAFVDRPEPPQAEAAARELIDADGWDVEELLFVREARLEEIDEGIPARAAFEQALSKGIALVYYKFPLGSTGRHPGATPVHDSIVRILRSYHDGHLSADQAAKAFLDEMGQTRAPLNLPIDPRLLEAIKREQERRGKGAA
jgi:hypothetical protein